MKVYGILRGFPGLGRVMSGMTLLSELRDRYIAQIRLYTYCQGNTVLDSFGFSKVINEEPLDREVTSLGLDPVSKISAWLIDDIMKWQPDVVIIDGEPQLIELLSLCYDKRKIVSLLNPSDINNPSLPYSTQKFFHNAFCKAGTLIIHGINNKDKTLTNFEEKDCKVHNINTIIRKEIIMLRRNENNKVISCVLGGGSQFADKAFVNSTVSLGISVLEIAAQMPEYTFNLYCNDLQICKEIHKNNVPENVNVFEYFSTGSEIYGESDLIICRAGRNTISEIIYLNIPAIVVAAGNNYRTREQIANIQNTTKDFPSAVEFWDGKESDELKAKIENALSRERFDNEFVPGNGQAISIILELKESAGKYEN